MLFLFVYLGWWSPDGINFETVWAQPDAVVGLMLGHKWDLNLPLHRWWYMDLCVLIIGNSDFRTYNPNGVRLGVDGDSWHPQKGKRGWLWKPSYVIITAARVDGYCYKPWIENSYDQTRRRIWIQLAEVTEVVLINCIRDDGMAKRSTQVGISSLAIVKLPWRYDWSLHTCPGYLAWCCLVVFSHILHLTHDTRRNASSADFVTLLPWQFPPLQHKTYGPHGPLGRLLTFPCMWASPSADALNG
jgi:hypothetical protein